MSRAYFLVTKEAKGSILCVIMSIFLSFSCSSEKEKIIDELKKEFERGNYNDVVLLSERALERGVASGDLYYYYGMALARMGSDFEAFGKLEKAARMRSDLANTIARELFNEGRKDFDNGRKKRAAACMREAARIDPGLNLEAFLYLVADKCYDEADYQSAVFYYKGAVQAFPDTIVARSAYMRMADSYLRMNLNGKAEEVYRHYVERFEGGRGEVNARWQLARILLAKGERAVRLGNYDQAREATEEILEVTDNMAVKQQALFIMGEACEGMGEYSLALEKFREIIRIDQGALGSTFSKALKKIEEYKRAGFESSNKEDI